MPGRTAPSPDGIASAAPNNATIDFRNGSTFIGRRNCQSAPPHHPYPKPSPYVPPPPLPATQTTLRTTPVAPRQPHTQALPPQVCTSPGAGPQLPVPVHKTRRSCTSPSAVPQGRPCATQRRFVHRHAFMCSSIGVRRQSTGPAPMHKSRCPCTSPVVRAQVQVSVHKSSCLCTGHGAVPQGWPCATPGHLVQHHATLWNATPPRGTPRRLVQHPTCLCSHLGTASAGTIQPRSCATTRVPAQRDIAMCRQCQPRAGHRRMVRLLRGRVRR